MCIYSCCFCTGYMCHGILLALWSCQLPLTDVSCKWHWCKDPEHCSNRTCAIRPACFAVHNADNSAAMAAYTHAAMDGPQHVQVHLQEPPTTKIYAAGVSYPGGDTWRQQSTHAKKSGSRKQWKSSSVNATCPQVSQCLQYSSVGLQRQSQRRCDFRT